MDLRSQDNIFSLQVGFLVLKFLYELLHLLLGPKTRYRFPLLEPECFPFKATVEGLFSIFRFITISFFF